MSKKKNKKKVSDVEIDKALKQTYQRINYLYILYHTIHNIEITAFYQSTYFDLILCLRAAFATTTYTWINGLLNSGKYSFRIFDAYFDIKNKVNEIKNKINKIIPNYTEIRNETFCHINNLISSKIINNIYYESNFEQIYSLLI